MKYDIVIGIVPIVRRVPQPGPALLKASVERAGFKCKVIDWNIDLWDTNKETDVFWTNRGFSFSFDNTELDEQTLKVIDRWVEDLKKMEIGWLAISIYGYMRNHTFAKEICKKVREQIPQLKIIAGGYGVSIDLFGQQLKNKGLIDEYVIGEGEEVLVELLKRGSIENNISPQIEDVNSIPFPDYSDFDFDKYPHNKMYFITGRGCIFKCKFCRRMVPKYRARNGEDVAREVLDIYQKYGVTNFVPADALTNGNPKELYKFCETICKYKDEGLLPNITWAAWLVCLPERVMPKGLYRLLKLAGCIAITYGIESGSKRVRQEMNKNMTDESIDYHLNQCVKHELEMSLIFMVGYYTETEEDFQQTMNFITKYHKFKDEVKLTLTLGPTLMLEKGTYLHTNQKKIGIKKDSHGYWYYKDNTMLTRINRWLRLYDHCIKLGFTDDSIDTKSKTMLLKIKDHITRGKDDK